MRLEDIYLTKNEKIVVPNLRVDIFSFRVFNALLQSYSHRAYSTDQSYQRVELNYMSRDARKPVFGVSDQV